MAAQGAELHAAGQATKAKIHFVKRSGKAGKHGRMHPVMAEYFDDDQLEEEYGGTLTGQTDMEVFFPLEKAAFEMQQKLRTQQLEELAHREADAKARQAVLPGGSVFAACSASGTSFSVVNYLHSLPASPAATSV